MHISDIFQNKSYYKMKQIMLSKVMKTISFLSSSKWNSYILYDFQNIIMIFIHLVLVYVIN